MKNDFKPVVGHRFNLRGDWGGVLDCEVLAVEPNRTLSYTWDFAHDDAAYNLKSVVTFTLTPTSTGTHLRMEQSGFRPDQKQAYRGRQGRVAAVLCQAGAGFGADGLSSRQRAPAFRLVFKGGPNELEQLDSADPPLAVDHLYGGRHRQLHRLGSWEEPAHWVYLLPLLPLFLLMLTGLYMFVLPYAARWRSGRRTADRSERNGQQDVQEAGEGREEGGRRARRAEVAVRRGRPSLGRQPADREGLRRRPRAGLHRGHAGLEKRRRAPPRRAHRAHRPRRAQGGQMELAASMASRTTSGSSASIASRNT